MKNLFEGKGLKNGLLLSLSPNEAFDLCGKGAKLVDVREDYLNSFKMFGVEKVIYLPKSLFSENYQQLSRDEYLIFADSAGLRSKEAVLFLLGKGYDKIANLAGGIVEWERDGLPLNIDISERLTGSCMCQLKPRDRKSKT